MVYHGLNYPHDVAPRAGAWIETIYRLDMADKLVSRPVRARGLKHIVGLSVSQLITSRPVRARGLKPEWL